MRPPAPPVGLGRIFGFWAPLAATWLLMSIEGPFLAAVLARLDDPKHNLAAFGVAFAVAILVESPVVMLLSASTALVDGARSFRALRRFMLAWNLVLTAAMLVLVLTPLWRLLARHALGLDDASRGSAGTRCCCSCRGRPRSAIAGSTRACSFAPAGRGSCRTSGVRAGGRGALPRAAGCGAAAGRDAALLGASETENVSYVAYGVVCSTGSRR